MGQRCARVAGLRGGLAEAQAREAPLVATRLGVFRSRDEQRYITGQPAPDLLPGLQGEREPKRGIGVVVHGPGQRAAHGGILGVKMLQAGHLRGTGLQPLGGLRGQLRRVRGERGRGLAIVVGLGK
jgi:hypothetical protein